MAPAPGRLVVVLEYLSGSWSRSGSRLVMVVVVNEEEWYSCQKQKRPFGKTTDNENLAAVADRTLNIALRNGIYAELLLIRPYNDAGE